MKKLSYLLAVLLTALLGACALGELPEAKILAAPPPVAAPDSVMPAPFAIPARIFWVTDYGAVGDGKTLNTKALQKAIDTCAQAGGGLVLVPPGRFLTGPLTLASSLELRVEKGATLLMSDKIADYPVTNNRFANCISADKCHDIAITGGGTIDGQGAMWWANYVNSGPHRPFLVVLNSCKRVLVKDITLQNSPMFHLVPQRCQDVRIENVHITAPVTAKNTDGLDPSGWNFWITGCTFDVGDDDIALKPSGRIDPTQSACKNFLIEHCTFLHGHGMSVGGQTPGGLDGLTVRDCTFNGTEAGIRLKAPRGSGGLSQNLTYENLTMTDVKVAILITSYYPKIPTDPAADPAQPVDATTPIWRHIHISHVTASGGRTAGQIIGLPEMPISDVVLTDVHLSAQEGVTIAHAKGIRFVNSQVIVQKGTALTATDADVQGL